LYKLATMNRNDSSAVYVGYALIGLWMISAVILTFDSIFVNIDLAYLGIWGNVVGSLFYTKNALAGGRY